MLMDDWNAGKPCSEDGIEFCSRCKPHEFGQVVYVTGGGSAFHKIATCKLLTGGLRSVERRSGTAGEVKGVATQEALGEGRFPCQSCFPSPTTSHSATAHRSPASSRPRSPSPRAAGTRRVRPQWIMERWMNKWGHFNQSQQAKFLKHPKIDEIAAHERNAIGRAISKDHKLDHIAEQLAWGRDSAAVLRASALNRCCFGPFLAQR